MNAVICIESILVSGDKSQSTAPAMLSREDVSQVPVDQVDSHILIQAEF